MTRISIGLAGAGGTPESLPYALLTAALAPRVSLPHDHGNAAAVAPHYQEGTHRGQLRGRDRCPDFQGTVRITSGQGWSGAELLWTCARVEQTPPIERPMSSRGGPTSS